MKGRISANGTRRLIAGGVALVMAFAVSGCGRDQSKGRAGDAGEAAAAKPKIYFIVKASESGFWQIVVDGGLTAGRELDVEVVVQAPVSESDVAKQIAIVENAISARPDAIVLAPTVSDALVPAIEKAASRNIPVIIIDSAANTDKKVSFLASDNLNIGRLAADRLAAALEKRSGKAAGQVACLTYMSGVGSLEARKQGFLKRIEEKYPAIEIVAFQDAQGKQGTSLSIVQNFLTAFPDLAGIFANNQYTGDETVRALDMKQRKGLAVVVVDAGPQEIWGLSNGFVDAVIVQKPWDMGYMGVEYALKAINGEEIPPFVDTGTAAITPEMMESGEAESLLNPVEFHKKDG